MGLRLGTRGSALALAQATQVADALGGAELITIRTSGDEAVADPDSRARGRAGERDAGGDKSRFVREIERALLAGEVDLAVHSAKDLPTEIPDGLELAGVPARESPLDACIGSAGSLAELPEGARVGTSSLRRRAQLLALRPDLDPVELRGNVDTRLARLAAGDFDAIVLAAAGLHRLGRVGEVAFLFEAAEMTPSPGQGSLALQVRVGDAAAADAAAGLSEPAASAELRAERAAVKALEASCNTPLGVLARADGKRLAISGFCGLPGGDEWIRDHCDGDAAGPEAAGRELAERMNGAGAAELLARAERIAEVGA